MIIEKVLVTGGAGFIGSHLVDEFMSNGSYVIVFDNLSHGSLKNIREWVGNPNFLFVKGDLLRPATIGTLRGDRYDLVLHLAANPDVRVSSVSPQIHFEQNIVATYNLLEHTRKFDICSWIAFTSSSTVYGDAEKIPTPEDYGPLRPISIYGASKLACESLITAYSSTYGFKATIFRLANIVGSRGTHGIIPDFIQKLMRNKKRLEILGDGKQQKSYLHVSDCAEAIMLGLEKASNVVEIYNVGSEDQIDVKTIAQIVVEVMGLKEVEFVFTGGVNGGRGWKGDVINMLLDVRKLKSLGWKPKLSSQEAVKKAALELLANSSNWMAYLQS